MAKHIYDEKGKYKGKILSDEEHSKRTYSRPKHKYKDGEYTGEILTSEEYYRFIIAKKAYTYKDAIIEILTEEEHWSRLRYWTPCEICGKQYRSKAGRNSLFPTSYLHDTKSGICRKCIKEPRYIKITEWYDSNKFLLFLLIFFWPAAVYGYLKQKGKI